MTSRIFVSRDSTALAFGADATARAIAAEAAKRGIDVTIVRNGSRGMFWLEPLVEIDAPGGRVGYGPIRAADVPALFDAGFERGNVHGLRVGPVEMITFFERQERLTFARVGLTDPVSVDDYRAHGGYRGLDNALAMSGEDIVKAVTDSGLRGRGGAAFPAGIKWKTVLATESAQKYIVCNADEGDSGTFSDRMLMEGDPLCLVEGMTIAGLAVGATQGYIYLRSEYPHAHRALNEAIANAYAAGYLGASIKGTSKRFDLEVRLGAAHATCAKLACNRRRWRTRISAPALAPGPAGQNRLRHRAQRRSKNLTRRCRHRP